MSEERSELKKGLKSNFLHDHYVDQNTVVLIVRVGGARTDTSSFTKIWIPIHKERLAATKGEWAVENLALELEAKATFVSLKAWASERNRERKKYASEMEVLDNIEVGDQSNWTSQLLTGRRCS